jgi:microcompartment protein CcmL/EutN
VVAAVVAADLAADSAAADLVVEEPAEAGETTAIRRVACT